MPLSPAAEALRQTLRSGLRSALSAAGEETSAEAALPPMLGVAVSGGSDSMALLHLLHELTQSGPTELRVVTVDHGLRPESRSEAEYVAAHAAGLGLSHDILTWADPATSGNLQDAARQARYELLTDWATERGISAIAVGHTADDQAETVLMRLARAAGVTGLCAMPWGHRRNGIAILRPLLGLRRAALRQELAQRGVTWLEDPSNLNRKFERIRMRDALETLEPLGLTVENLAAVAAHMQRAEAALSAQTVQAAQHLVHVAHGAVVIERAGFLALPQDIRRRLLLAALSWRMGPGYPPRRAPVEAALTAVAEGRGSTLAGCQILSRKGKIWVFRELQAVKHCATACPEALERAPQPVVWDHIWNITPPPFDPSATAKPPDAATPEGVEIRPLGDPDLLGDAGHALAKMWREMDLPRALLMVSPALWRRQQFLGALVVKTPAEWRCHMTSNEFICPSEALSH